MAICNNNNGVGCVGSMRPCRSWQRSLLIRRAAFENEIFLAIGRDRGLRARDSSKEERTRRTAFTRWPIDSHRSQWRVGHRIVPG